MSKALLHSHPSGRPSLSGGVFVAGETEVDKPLLVEQPRRLLQQLYPPPIVLDQIAIRPRTAPICFCSFGGGDRNLKAVSFSTLRLSCVAPLVMRLNRGFSLSMADFRKMVSDFDSSAITAIMLSGKQARMPSTAQSPVFSPALVIQMVPGSHSLLWANPVSLYVCL